MPKIYDWDKMRNEYISDPKCTYRDLQKEYGVTLSSISKTATREGWARQRKQFLKKVETQTLSDAFAKRCANEAKLVDRHYSTAEKMYNIVDKLLNVLQGWVDQDMVNTPAVLESLVRSLKGLKDVEGIKTDLDIEEQKAKIEQLKSQVKDVEKSLEINVKYSSDTPLSDIIDDCEQGDRTNGVEGEQVSLEDLSR